MAESYIGLVDTDSAGPFDNWPANYPDKSKFKSSDLQVTTTHWEFRRNAGDGGDDAADDLKVPPDHVLVGWSGQEGSCIGCPRNRVYQLVLNTDNPLSIPIGIRPGTRLEPSSDPTGPGGRHGASFTGDCSLISVPYSVWLPVMLTMLPHPV